MITQCKKTGRTCEVTGCTGCWTTVRKWVDLTDDDRNEIETKVCPHIDSHDFELIGNAYIAAFKEKNK